MFRWFDNIGITYKLTISYTVIAALVGLVGYLGLVDIRILEENSKQVYEKQLKGITTLSKIAETYADYTGHMRDLILTEQPAQKESLRFEMRQYMQHIEKLSKSLEETLDSEREQKRFTAYQLELAGLRKDVVTFEKYAMDVASHAEAQVFLKGELNLRTAQLQEQIDALIDAKIQRADEFQKLNATLVVDARNELIFWVLLAFVMTGVITIFTYLKISKPTVMLSEKARQISVGNLAIAEMGIPRKDEIGRVARSFDAIVKNMSALVEHAQHIAEGDYSNEITPRSQKDRLAYSLNEMNAALEEQNWLKDGVRELNTLLSGHFSIREIGDRTVSFLCRFLETAYGVVYVYDPDDEMLKLYGSHAFVERDGIQREFPFGQGIVGQAAQEKSPIILTNVPDTVADVESGTIKRKPVSTFTFPLLYEDEICGVIELAAFRSFTERDKRFIQEVVEVIASHIYSAVQAFKINALLKTAEKAQREAEQRAEEIQEANQMMEEQQEQLQVQSEELRQNMEEMAATQEELQFQMQRTEIVKSELAARMEVLNMTALVAETDLNGNITFANNLFCERAGLEESEVIGRPLASILHNDADNMWATLRKGESYSESFKSRSRAGFTFWVNATFAPVLDAEGNPQKFIAMAFDVTQNVKQRREIEKLLKETKKNMEQLQTQEEELMQQNEEMQQQSEELQQTNEELQQQQEHLAHQQRLTEERNQALETAQLELEEKASELEQASQYKSEFLANMSHELRTPLNSIILLSDMLRRNTKQNLVPKEVQKAGIIYQSGNDLLNLINDILDISKIEAGKMVVNIHHFQSFELTEELQGLFEEMANQKGLYFKTEDTLKKELYNDKDKLKQVLKNFLSNAFKFTKKGGVTLSISDSGDPNLPVRVGVRDTGIGIPPEKQKLIFEAFQQADGSVSREFGGTGLGLSISREMTRMLGGEVHLESKAGEGSEFYVLLPLRNTEIEESINNKNLEVNYAEKKESKRRRAPQSQDDVQKSEESVRSKMTAYNPTMQRLEIDDDRATLQEGDRVILIVEDNVDYANSLAEISRNVGFKAYIATTGQGALDFVNEFEPMGVLLDLGLPDISGVDVLDELKNTLKFRHIPISIVSARDSDQNLIEQGAVRYLQKPVEAWQIKDTVQRLGIIAGRVPKKMLVVEDNETHREIVMELIGREGVECTGAGSEDEAQSALKSGDFDSAIVDLDLKSGGNGLNICRYMKENRIDIPIIIYTGRELSEAERQEIKMYAATILSKDESPENLLDKAQIFLHTVFEAEGEEGQHLSDLKTLEAIAQARKEEIDTTVKEELQNAPHNGEDEHAEVHDGQVVNAALEAILAGEDENRDSTDVSSAALAGKRILIVDDDVRNVFVLTSALENYEAEIFEAFNGQEALETLEDDGEMDLILMDIMMPVMDGYEATRSIRANDRFKHIPIIAVTAKALKEDRQKCIDAGADEYMTKPIDYNLLVKNIQHFLKVDLGEEE